MSQTLFVSGFPRNVQEPDTDDLFKDCDGFLSSRIRLGSRDKKLCFVEFDSEDNARAAMERFKDFKYKEDCILGIEFAIGSGPSHDPSPRKRPRSERPRRDSDWDRHRDIDRAPRFRSYPFPPFPSTPPSSVSSCLYVQGLPSDATQREVSHIFRPFWGYQSLRLISNLDSRDSAKPWLCFVEFASPHDATVALNTLQGYRMDVDDMRGIDLSYACSDRRGTHRQHYERMAEERSRHRSRSRDRRR